MKNKLGIYLIVLIALFSFTHAISFQENFISSIIIPDINHPAEVEIEFLDAPSGEYEIYTLSNVFLSPRGTFEINSNKTTRKLEIFPTGSLTNRGPYTFTYYIRDSKDNDSKGYIRLKVMDLRDVIEISSNSNHLSDEVTFFIKNKENTTIKNIKASFSSILFSTTEDFDLGPFEKKEFTASVDSEKLKKIPAGSYLLDSTFKIDDYEVKISGKINFGERKEIETISQKKGFFIRAQEERKLNTGNTKETVQISLSKSIFLVPFTFTNIVPDKTQTSLLKKEYLWTNELGPSEEVQIIMRTNYLIPLLIVLVFIGAISFIILKNSKKIEIKKSASYIKTKGGEFALRVTIKINSTKNLTNVSIVDTIPPLLKVHDKFGAIKPTHKSANGRKLKWDLGNLSTGETKTISYVVYSKVGVVGKFSLPKSTLIFEENGNLFETYSNNVFFLSEQIKK